MSLDEITVDRLAAVLTPQQEYWRMHLVECLELIQNECSFFELNLENLRILARILSVSPVALYLAFDEFTRMAEAGARLEICDNLTCLAKGALELKNYILTHDHGLNEQWGFQFVKCLSSCATGPCIKWDGKLFEKVNLEDFKRLISPR